MVHSQLTIIQKDKIEKHLTMSSYPTIWLKYRLYPSRVSCWNIKRGIKKIETFMQPKWQKQTRYNKQPFCVAFVCNKQTYLFSVE